MGNRGQKRVETVEDLPPPADKRACNLQENRPSTSSSSVQAQANSSGSGPEAYDHNDMETTSSASGMSHSEGDPDGESVYGSCDSDEAAQGRNELREYQRQRSSSDHDKFQDILASVGDLNDDASKKLVFLTELCEVLSLCNEHSISTKTADTLSPYLVKLARDEMIPDPDIVLLAIRAMTYLCDLFPRSSGFLVRDDAVSVLCQKLMAIDDMDVAEQCLQALEKISREQPLACLQAGAIMAVMSFLDFFSTSIQRVALSTVMNICRKLSSECTSPFMDAVPILCNLLRYEDRKLVEIVAVCLIRITERVRQSPALLDELCEHGLIQPIFDLLSSSNRTTLPQTVYNGLLGTLAKLSLGSFAAFKTLYELNISSVLKDILSTSDISHGVSSSHTTDGQCNQIYGVLKLLNHLLPTPIRDQNSSESSEKENYLLNQTELVQNLGRDNLPLLIQVVTSGANSYTCYSGLSVIKKLIYWCKSDTLVDSLKSANISSFLASVLTRKDQHVLLLALQTAELILQKLSDEFLHSFVKEGVFFSIDALLVPDKCSQATSETSSQAAAPEPLDSRQKIAFGGVARCLCYSFASGTERGGCKLEKDSVYNLAQHIRSSYFLSELLDSDESLTAALQELRTLSNALRDMIKSNTLDQDDDKFYDVLHQIVSKLNGKEPISTFELVESGIVKSLVDFLSGGQNLRKDRECCTDHGDVITVGKGVEVFARLFLLSSDSMSQDLPLSTLVQKLQSALSSLETFPVVLNNACKMKETYTDYQSGRYMRFPCLRVCFVRAEGETNLVDYSKSYLPIDSLSSIDAIEALLWPKVNSEAQKQTNSEALKQSKELGSLECDVVMSDGSEMQGVAEEGLQLASPKLLFFLDGQQLDPESTIYQAILQKHMKQDETVTISKAWWSQVYTLTYKRAENRPDNLKQCTCSVQKFENPSPVEDILHLLKLLDSINRSVLALVSQDRLGAFAEGKLDDLDALKYAVPSVPQIEFVSSKMTEKLEQQMRDPMAVTVGGIPTWCNDLMSSSPLIFSFEARSKYFRLAAFGSSCGLTHQPSHGDSGASSDRRHSSSGMPRKKFSVSRSNILESATKMMEMHAGHKVSLEVEYEDEVGTGLGPTLEFYTLVSHELQKTGMEIWREDHESFNSQFVTSPLGLFPRPWSPSANAVCGVEFGEVSKKFVLLGQIVAKALQDGRVLDLSFSKAFYKLILGQELGLFDILSFDPGLGRTLLEFAALVGRKLHLESTRREISFLEYESCFRDTRIEDLCLDFTLPGYPEFLLGSELEDETVTMRNLEEYVSLVVDATLKSGISKQVEAFKSGFNQVFPIEHLQIFTEDELERLLCGEQESWAVDELLDHVKFDHGYTASSTPIINLLEIIQEFDKKKQRAFLQFVTGAPRLPLGGFASLNPKLTIVRKHCSVGSIDSDLPSVMTCANYLKLPPYSSKQMMKEKLVYAITEGQGSFHLS